MIGWVLPCGHLVAVIQIWLHFSSVMASRDRRGAIESICFYFFPQTNSFVLFIFQSFWARFSSVSIFVPFSKKLSVPVPVSLYHNICVECYIVWNVTIVSLKESERRNMETRLE